MREPLLAVLLALAVPCSALAQGRTAYYNTESVQVDPIAVVEVGGRQFVAAVNTPDNSVEIWDTHETAPIDLRFIARVRTGLEPVSLLWVSEIGRLYVANALSDAVTAIRLDPDPVAGVAATVERTVFVGDEPVAMTHLQFEEPDGEGGTVTRHTLLTAHRDQDHFSWIDALTLAPIAAVLDATVQKGDIDFDGQDDLIAIKAPRDIEVHCGRLFVLGEKGGGRPEYDFDLYSIPVTGGATRDLALPNTSNFNMAFAANDDLFVVGGHALHDELRDETAVRNAPTGFVVATLTMIRGACGASPAIKVRDVNLEPRAIEQQPLPPGQPAPFGAPAAALPAVVVPVPVMRPVTKAKAMTQLTSVAVFERADAATKVFFTAFGNDWLGVAVPSWSQHPNAWPIRRIRIAVTPGSSNPTAGPRGLALKPANPGDPDDPGHRLYVLNRLDNAITVIDPVAELKLDEVALRHDPTPLYVRRGRRFLYDARLGNGFNACATCHVDGRTDGLAWDLGDGQSPPIDPLLKDNASVTLTNFPADKNHMVTQSLQGLLNWEVEPEMQDLATNAPYHWRADREDFLAFRPAFVGLLGGPELDPLEMEEFEEFINSVHYPPNPRQPLDRTYSGVPFDGVQLSATEAQRGLMLFHVLGTVGTVACAHCHALPEGSENKIPLVLQFDNPFDPSEPLGGQPTEGAALRGLNQKLARLERRGSDLPEDSAITGLEGLLHTGFILNDRPEPEFANTDFNLSASINAFIRSTFAPMLGCALNEHCVNVQAVNQFLHEFDTGTAPIVGLPWTVDLANAADAGATKIVLDVLEDQSRLANAGLAVQAWLAGAERGFVYDPRLDRYVEEGGAAVLTRAGLLGQVTTGADLLVFVATPLGSERRVGSPTGQPAAPPPGGVPPAQVALLPMSPNTAYFNVPTLALNWFQPFTSTPSPAHGGFFAHTVRLFQMGVLTSSPGDDFGVGKRWEPSRRFRVAADGLDFDSRLELHFHDDPAQPSTPPKLALTPEDPAQVQTRAISLPLHPTGDADPGTGAPVYETHAELDPREFLMLMLGGVHHPAVVQALTDSTFQLTEDPLAPSLIFEADTRNWVYVRVVAGTGLPGDGGWQRLRLE